MSCGSTLAALLSSNSAKIYCEDHKGEEIRRYCKTCSTFVCLECILDEHKGHTILKISELAESKKDAIIELANVVKSSHIVELKARIQDSKESKRVNRGCVIDCIKRINRRATGIRLQLNKIRHGMITDIKESQKYEIERLDDIEKYLIKEVSGLTTLVKSIEKAVSSNNEQDMIHLGLSLEDAIQNIQHCPPSTVEALEFCSGELSQSILENMFGYCRKKEIFVEVQAETGTVTQINVERRVDTISSYKLAEESVTSVVPCRDDAAWVCIAGKRQISLQSEGEIRKTEDLDSAVIDLGMSIEGDIIAVLKKRYRLIRIKRSGQKLDFIDTKPLYPNGVHVTSQGDIYVSVIDSDTTDIIQDSKRSVIKYSSTGTGLQRFAKNSKGENLLTLPRKLTVTDENDVCVVDTTSLFTGRIVTLKPSGDQRYIYTGRDDLGMSAFNPTSVKCDSHGRIVISDFDNCVLHVLNKEGQLICLLNSNQAEGIYGPCAVGIGRNGSISIGTFDGYLMKIAALEKPEVQLTNDGTKSKTQDKQPGESNELPKVKDIQDDINDNIPGKNSSANPSNIKTNTTQNVITKQEEKKIPTEKEKSIYPEDKRPKTNTKQEVKLPREKSHINRSHNNKLSDRNETKKQNQPLEKMSEKEAEKSTNISAKHDLKTNIQHSDNKAEPLRNDKDSKETKSLDESAKSTGVVERSSQKQNTNDISKENSDNKLKFDKKNKDNDELVSQKGNADTAEDHKTYPIKDIKTNDTYPSTSQTKNDKVLQSELMSKTKSDNVLTNQSTSQTKSDNVLTDQSTSQTKSDNVLPSQLTSQNKIENSFQIPITNRTKSDSTLQNQSTSQINSVHGLPIQPTSTKHTTEHNKSINNNFHNSEKRPNHNTSEGKQYKANTSKISKPPVKSISGKDLPSTKHKSLEPHSKHDIAIGNKDRSLKVTKAQERNVVKTVGKPERSEDGMSTKIELPNKGKADKNSTFKDKEGKEKEATDKQTANDNSLIIIDQDDKKTSTSTKENLQPMIKDVGRYRPDQSIKETLKNGQT